MTNQNDTQDEAERLDHPCRQTCSGWKQGHDKGYRAGVASKEPEIAELKKRHSHLASGCDEMMTVQAALREENSRLKAYVNEMTCTICDLSEQLAASRAEVERLVKAADKFRVATCKYADGKMRRVVFTMHLDQISEALANYNTDSGDGSGKMETNK